MRVKSSGGGCRLAQRAATDDGTPKRVLLIIARHLRRCAGISAIYKECVPKVRPKKHSGGVAALGAAR